MLKNISFENFRSFKEGSLFKLSGINVLTGQNGSGKTTVLESVFLLSGGANSSLVMSISSFRNDATFNVGNETVFTPLFFDLDPTKAIRMWSEGGFGAKSAKSARELKISPIFSTLPSGAESTTRQSVSGVQFDFKGPKGHSRGSAQWNKQAPQLAVSVATTPLGPVISPMLVELDKSPQPDLILAHFVSPYFTENMKEIHDRLQDAIKQRRIDGIVSRLQKMERRLRSIVPLTDSGLPRIYVDIGLPTLAPVSVLGSGFVSLLKLCTTLSAVENGVILIDEIENGLHYSVRRHVIEMLFEHSRERNVQFFVATHSAEIVRLFGEVSKESKERTLSLYRLHKENGCSQARYFDRADIQIALDLDTELR